jgi:hypothetical protein
VSKERKYSRYCRKRSCQNRKPRKGVFEMGLILLIIVIVLLIGVAPTWPHSKNWGYGPSGGLGLILVILLIFVLLGYLPRGF